MKAMRCVQCDDVRWSFLGLAPKEPARCVICGGETVPERRRPDGGRRGGVERRGLLSSRAAAGEAAPHRPAAPAP